MRKLIGVLATLTLTVALVVPAAAQNVSLGVKGGLNFADLVGKNAKDVNAATAVRAIGGGFAVFEITRAVGVQPEFLYTQKGSKWDQDGVTGKFKLDYIEVPVLLRLSRAPAESKFVPAVFVGPSIAYKVDCKVKGEDAGVELTMTCSDLEAQVRDWDFSAVLGLGADFNVGNTAIVLDGRYTRGVTKIDSSGVDDDVHNSVFSAMVGVKFALGAPRLAFTR